MSTEALKKAIEIAGNQTSLGKLVGLSQPYIWNWLNRDQSIPAEYVIPVAQAIDWQVTPHELRPDIYPNPTDGLPANKTGEAAA
ncbi:transcriptional regulator [Marinobacter adhaerens]|uniref:transcriptional regulator n=1 Tax=Marinobacter adhaerens TaxID=1033846 RepID=UPI003D29A97D